MLIVVSLFCPSQHLSPRPVRLMTGIHDIDIGRWLLSASDTPTPNRQVHRVFATGQNTRHPELAERGDCDNGLGTVEFTNGKILTFHLSRTSMHGHDCFAEIFAENGKMIING